MSQLPSLRRALFVLGFVAAIAGTSATTGLAAEEAGEPRHAEWSFDGPLGTFDRAALQRGFQVYKEICANCHSLSRVAIRTLGEDGGPGFTDAEVRALASAYRVPAEPDERGQTVDQNGRPLMREATPADYFPPPFANDNAARAANNGAFPPDLSLIVKARTGHQDYIYSLLIGYGQTPPEGIAVARGRYYNPYFAGGQISMPQILFESQVTYADGTPATIDQMSRDVTTFLAWTAEPKMEERKAMGVGVMLFLFAFAGLTFASYRKLWRDQH